MARYTIIIPARYGSSRFPGKPLAKLRGASGFGKSLIQRSWEAATEAADPSDVWVATDDDRVAREVETFGGQVVMTPATCGNGTERCAAAAERIGDCADIVVNFQGDAPLTPADLPGKLSAAVAKDPSIAMATPALPCSESVYSHLLADRDAGRVGGTTVVFDRTGRALYFSKSVIPYGVHPTRSAARDTHLHLGVYAYRRQALKDYAAGRPASLEQLEGLEQLRFLDQGRFVQIVLMAPPDWDCIELNNPTDIPAVEAALVRRGMD